VNLQLDHRIELQIPARKERIQFFGLLHRPRKAIENKPILRLWRIDALGDQRDHHFVRDKLAAGYDVLHPEPEGGAGGYGNAQQVAGRQRNDVVARDDALGLRALARAGWSEEDKPHRRLPRNLALRISPSY